MQQIYFAATCGLQTTPRGNENGNVDDWAESDLAWELADAISPLPAECDRAQLYATTLGSGESYTAIDTVLQIMAHQSFPVPPELVAKLVTWLDAYAHSHDAPRLGQLLRAVTGLS